MSITQAIKTLGEQLSWRGPNGKVQGRIVVTRGEAEALVSQLLNDTIPREPYYRVRLLFGGETIFVPSKAWGPEAFRQCACKRRRGRPRILRAPKDKRRQFIYEAVAPLADGTRAIETIALELGVDNSQVRSALAFLRRKGVSAETIDIRSVRPHAGELKCRNDEIVEAIQGGEEDYTAIGRRFGITRERVRQIANKNDVKGIKSHAVRSPALAARKQAHRDRVTARRAARDARVAELRRLVEVEGMSFLAAERSLGLPRNGAFVLAKLHNIVSTHQSRNPKYAKPRDGASS